MKLRKRYWRKEINKTAGCIAMLVAFLMIPALSSTVLADSGTGSFTEPVHDDTVSTGIHHQPYFKGFRTVRFSDQIRYFHGWSVSGILQLMPGMGHGGTNIHGLGPGAGRVTRNGQPLASTSADRSPNLESQPADMVYQLEIIRVLTPDMPSDGTGGFINLSTPMLSTGNRHLKARVGGGLNSRFMGVVNPDAHAVINFRDVPNDRVLYHLNLAYQQDTPSHEFIGSQWRTENFEPGVRDVLHSMDTGMQFTPGERLGATFDVIFQPTEQTTWQFGSLFNYQSHDETGYHLHHPMPPYIDERHTHTLALGLIHYHSDLAENRIYQYTLHAGMQHRFDTVTMNMDMGWSHGRSNSEGYHTDFRTARRYAFIVDNDDRLNPTIEISPASEITTYPTTDRFNFHSISSLWHQHTDNTFSGNVDFEVPAGKRMVRFGSGVNQTDYLSDFDRFTDRYDQPLDLQSFDEIHHNSKWNTFGQGSNPYTLPVLIDPYKVRNWYQSQFPDFNHDPGQRIANSFNEFYAGRERTYSVFGMNHLREGRFQLLFGIRVEHTEARYDGRDGENDESGQFTGATDTRFENRYTRIYPNLQLAYSPSHRNHIHLAYTRTSIRPGYNMLSVNSFRRTPFHRDVEGNPALVPVISDNLNINFLFEFQRTGQFTMGYFYKHLKNTIYETVTRVGPSGIAGTEMYTDWMQHAHFNGDKATVFGLETTLQMDFTFLSGALSGMGIYSNYTYTFSQTGLIWRPYDMTPLPGQRPHILNASLYYNLAGITARTTWQYASSTIMDYSRERRRIPRIDPHALVWFDPYVSHENVVSVHLGYQVTPGIQIWSEAGNLLNHRRIWYHFDQNHYPAVSQLTGRTFHFGIQYKL